MSLTKIEEQVVNYKYLDKGQLVLIPTPLSDHINIDSTTLSIIMEGVKQSHLLFVHEDIKVARRRWISWGLPREMIESFLVLNEHNRLDQSEALLKELKKGKTVFLMSDCGLPAFCDPGQYLVDRCHQNGIKVTSTPFANSIALGVALSGFPHDNFVFEGFLPSKEKELRKEELKRIWNSKRMAVLMDTPYRLNRLLEEIYEVAQRSNHAREIFLALDLNSNEELLLRGNINFLKKSIGKEKREFILIVSPLIKEKNNNRKFVDMRFGGKCERKKK